jgi:hypothetical protein
MVTSTGGLGFEGCCKGCSIFTVLMPENRYACYDMLRDMHHITTAVASRDHLRRVQGAAVAGAVASRRRGG